MMNADEMAAQIMLPRERSSTRSVRACEWLGAVRIMCSHVSFQIVSACESSRATGATVPATIIRTCAVICDGTCGHVAAHGDGQVRSGEDHAKLRYRHCGWVNCLRRRHGSRMLWLVIKIRRGDGSKVGVDDGGSIKFVRSVAEGQRKFSKGI